MKVYVIMGNDYPDAVFESQESADRYCEEKKKDKIPGQMGHRIYWRSYPFELQK